jgi:hypothetical protein
MKLQRAGRPSHTQGLPSSLSFDYLFSGNIAFIAAENFA